jgi:formate hydrogenlyase subunit 4
MLLYCVLLLLLYVLVALSDTFTTFHHTRETLLEALHNCTRYTGESRAYIDACEQMKIMESQEIQLNTFLQVWSTACLDRITQNTLLFLIFCATVTVILKYYARLCFTLIRKKRTAMYRK